MRKTILSFMLALLMIVTSLPITANAANTPRLVYRFAGYDEENQVHCEDPTDWLHDEMNTHAGNGSPVTLYFVDANGNETRLSASDVTSSDTNILTFEADQEAPEVLHLRYRGLGTAYLNYVHTDNQTYSITFNVDLPMVGFYTTQTATKAGYVPEYTVSDNSSNVLYLISTVGDIDSVELNWNFQRIANIRKVSDVVYEVQITGIPSAGYWYGADVFVKDPYDSGRIRNYGANIELINAKSALMYCYAEWENDQPSPSPDLQNYVYLAKGYDHDVYVYFLEQGANKSLLNTGKLTSSNPNVVTVENNEWSGDMVRLNAVDFGTAQITYTHTNGQTYSIDVEVGLPDVGFYSTTTAGKNSYLTEFDVTDDGPNVFYLVSQAGEIKSLSPDSGICEVADVVISNDGSYATITVTGTPGNYRYGMNVEIENPNGWSGNYGASIQLNNKKTSLVYSYSDWDNGLPRPNPYKETSINISKGYSSDIYVFFMDQGTSETLMKAGSLKSSNPNVVTVENNERHGDLVRLNAVDFGTAQITYTHTNGKTYSFDVTVGLPNLGFYTTATASQSSYITEFDMTDNGPNVFYLVYRNGKMNNIIFRNGMDQIATAELSNDGTYAVITLTGKPDNRWYDVQAEVTNDNGWTGRNGVSIRLNNKTTSLMFGYANWNNGVPSPNDNMRSNVDIAMGYSSLGYVYFMNQGTNREFVKAENLTSSNPDVVTIENHKEYENMLLLRSQGFGTSTISYTHTDGQTYSFDVLVALPDVGFYTTPTASESSYITEYTVSDKNSNVIYLVSSVDEITDVSLEDAFDQIADVTLGKNGTYAKITITGTPEGDRWYEVNATFTNRDGGMYRVIADIRLKDGNPYIGLCWPDEESMSGYGYPNRFLDTALGYGTDVWVYLFENGTETKLSISDLQSSDESVIKITDPGYSNGMVRLETVGWGTATISYTKNGKAHSIDVVSDTPDFGFYADKAISRENWILGFNVTEDNNTFYFMADNGIALDQVMPSQDLADIATVELSADKTWVKITVTGEPRDEADYGLEFEFTDPNGFNGSAGYYLESIKGLKPKVEFEDVVAGAFYETPVQWAVEKGITNGYGSATTFCPDTTCTRGQVVTFLWRAKGCPEPTSTVNPFTDIKESDYYYKAVLWAVENGITAGYGSSTIFNPDGACNRGQVATFLWRAEGQSSMSGAENPFTDVASGEYYYDAVLWAVANGVTNGYGGNTTFAPDVICNRGQIVTFLYRAEQQ